MEKIIGGIGLILFLSFLFAWPVKELWNGCLVGAIDGVHDVTWLQAWGISCLTGVLFKDRTGSSK